jgi:hypothetical protein
LPSPHSKRFLQKYGRKVDHDFPLLRQPQQKTTLYEIEVRAVQRAPVKDDFHGCRCAGFEISRPPANSRAQHAPRGVPQVVRMRITGHRTDSMERRYNILDVDDLKGEKRK